MFNLRKLTNKQKDDLLKKFNECLFNKECFTYRYKNQNPEFFNFEKNKSNLSSIKGLFSKNQKQDLGTFSDKFFCYLLEENKSPEQLEKDDWQKIWNAYDPSFASLLKKSDFEFFDFWKEKIVQSGDLTKFLNHFSPIFKKIKNDFTYTLTNKQLIEKSSIAMDLNDKSYEIDLLADGYVIDYKYITSWENDYLLQVINYYLIITKNTKEIELNGVGIFNTHANELILIEITEKQKQQMIKISENFENSSIVLSDEQREIVELENNTTLINAGPGSGKTEVIAQRIKYLIEKKNVDPTDILLVTYSRAACENMVERIEKTLEVYDANVKVKTFHGLAFEHFSEILRKQPSSPKLEQMSEASAMHLLKKTALLEHFLSTNQKIIHHSVIGEWFKCFASLYKRECEKKIFAKWYGRLEKKLQEEHSFYCTVYAHSEWMIDKEFNEKELETIFSNFKNPEVRKLLNKETWLFDEWLMKCVAHWKDNGAPEKYKHVFVDEFQDTNLLQYIFISSLCEEDEKTKIKNLWCIGDLDQSIYSFSGAYPDIFKQLVDDFPQTTIKVIKTNRRSVKNIVEISQELIKDCDIHPKFKKSLVHYREEINPEPIWIQYSSSQDIAEELIRIIKQEEENTLKTEIDFDLSEIAILTPRINNKKSPYYKFVVEVEINTIENLSNKDIFHYFTKEEKIHEKKGLWILLHLLLVLTLPKKHQQQASFHSGFTELSTLLSEELKSDYKKANIKFKLFEKDNKDKGFFQWLHNETKTGSYEELKAFIKALEEMKETNEIYLLNLFASWKQKINKEAIKKDLRDFVDAIIDTNYLDDFGIEKKLFTDHHINELATHINDCIKELKNKNDLYGSTFTNILDMVIAKNKLLKQKTVKNKIHVLSIHASKGKEYKYVFIVNLDENSLLSSIDRSWNVEQTSDFKNKLSEWEIELPENFDLKSINDEMILSNLLSKLDESFKKKLCNESAKTKQDFKKVYAIIQGQQFKLKETIRAFYVGITRAKDYLYICSPPQSYLKLIDKIAKKLTIIKKAN